MIVRAITLLRPWPSAIVHGPKRVENRTWWHPRTFPPGSLLAIHAGAGWDSLGSRVVERLWREFDPRSESHPRGIVGLAQLVRYDRINRDATESDPWACGPYAWRLGRVVALLTPLPCAGHQGLWSLPRDVEAQLLRTWAESA